MPTFVNMTHNTVLSLIMFMIAGLCMSFHFVFFLILEMWSFPLNGIKWLLEFKIQLLGHPN